MEWFKFYHNKWLTDRAINSLRPQDRLCFITLLCVTSQSDERNGIVTKYSEQEIIKLTQLDVDVYDDEKSDYHLAVGFTQRLADCGVIEIVDDKQILIKNFSKRQDTMLSPAERAKKYRDKKKVTNVTNKSDERNAREDKSREEKNREDKIKSIKTELKKEKYGQFYNVLLEPTEYIKLTEQYSVEATQSLIEELSNYMESTGKRYKNHYATLLNWARRKIQEHATKNKNFNTLKLTADFSK